MTTVKSTDSIVKPTSTKQTSASSSADKTTKNASSSADKTNEDSLASFKPESDAETKKNESIELQNMRIKTLQELLFTKESEVRSLRSQLGFLKDSKEIDGVNQKIKSVNKQIDGIYDEIFDTMMGVIQTRAIASSSSSSSSSSSTSGDYGSLGSNLSDGSLGGNIISIANKYMGYNEANGSYKKFTEGRAEAWCADFVTYVVKEAYAASGKKVPANFGSPAVNTLKSWGQSNGRWINKSNLDKVKPGDIMIQDHHTGIVVSVNKDGTVTTIEGNTSDKVAVRKQPLSSIVGFVSIA